jgi:3-oxoacyl-ACP reductase-like protein
MTQNDILILAKAGFTAQQIAALSATAPAAPAAPTAPVAPTVPAAPAAQAAPTAPAPLTYDQFQHELQKMALLGAHQSGKVETADSVLASIINPPASTEGGK